MVSRQVCLTSHHGLSHMESPQPTTGRMVLPLDLNLSLSNCDMLCHSSQAHPLCWNSVCSCLILLGWIWSAFMKWAIHYKQWLLIVYYTLVVWRLAGGFDLYVIEQLAFDHYVPTVMICRDWSDHDPAEERSLMKFLIKQYVRSRRVVVTLGHYNTPW